MSGRDCRCGLSVAAREQAPESNTVRVEIMNQDRLTADDHEGYVEWVGQGLAAFADCRGKLGTYPVTLDGDAAGELLCQLQVRADR